MENSFIKTFLAPALAAALCALAAACKPALEDKDFKVLSFSSQGCIGAGSSTGSRGYASATAGRLHLKYSAGNLLITLSGLQDNCSIKEGFDCKALRDGSVIYVSVLAKSPYPAKCICDVGDIVTELSGVEKGEYTLVYSYKSSSKDFTETALFTFSASLDQTEELEP